MKYDFDTVVDRAGTWSLKWGHPTFTPRTIAMEAVSYTHLDVYKRQQYTNFKHNPCVVRQYSNWQLTLARSIMRTEHANVLSKQRGKGQ